MDDSGDEINNTFVDPIRESAKNSYTPDFLKSQKNTDAKKSLGGAEKNATKAGASKIADSVAGASKAEESPIAGFKNSVTGTRAGAAGKAGAIGGILKNNGPIAAIIGAIVLVGGMLVGSQSLMPIAIQELIIEKFNSIGISSTSRSDQILDSQLNYSFTLKYGEGDTYANLFKFSENQIEGLRKNNIIVVENVGGEFTALLYKKNNQYIPVVGSDILNYNGYTESDLINAIKKASGLSNVGTPVDASVALADLDFKNYYTAASKTWRGGISGWFDKIMSNITEVKDGITRNRYVRYATMAVNKLDKSFQELAKKTKTASDSGVEAKREIEVDETYIDDDGIEQTRKVPEEVEIDSVGISQDDSDVSTEAMDTSQTSLDGATDEVGVQKVLNSKGFKVANAIADSASATCQILEAATTIYSVVEAYQSMQFLNLISGFLESVSKVKAGDGDASPVHEYSTNLTTVSDGKTAMSSAGMAWLTGSKATIDQNNESVQKVNIESIMSELTHATNLVQITASTYETCGYVKLTSSTLSLVTTVLSFIPVAGQAVKIGQIALKVAKKVAVAAVVATAMAIIVPKATKSLVQLIAKDAATEWFGEDLGNAIVSGANKYLGSNGTSGGQSPGNKEKVIAYFNEQNRVIAEEAEYQRFARSPFDITSKYTFLGSIAYSLMPLAYSMSLPSTIISGSNVVSNSIATLLPTASAIDTNSIMTSTGECPLLEAYGIVGDAFCNPYIITDTSTMNLSMGDVDQIVHRLNSNGNKIASVGNDYNIGGDNFNDDGSIKEGSNLGKYIVYCGERTSKYGLKDATIASSVTGSSTAKTIIGIIPGIGDIMSAADSIMEVDNMKWITGENCIADDSDGWNNEMRYYQRYTEDQRLLENINPGYTSTVTAYFEKYHTDNPIDTSLEGTLARFSGLDKETVSDTLALIDYLKYIEDYDPSTRYAFVEPAEEVPIFVETNNSTTIAMDALKLNDAIYFDLRSRVFLV